jgi:hypothetical protein
MNSPGIPSSPDSLATLVEYSGMEKLLHRQEVTSPVAPSILFNERGKSNNSVELLAFDTMTARSFRASALPYQNTKAHFHIVL